ncbi:MAG: leucine-rich repeat protein, partial [Oscillospiraceae bacterium]
VPEVTEPAAEPTPAPVAVPMVQPAAAPVAEPTPAPVAPAAPAAPTAPVAPDAPVAPAPSEPQPVAPIAPPAPVQPEVKVVTTSHSAVFTYTVSKLVNIKPISAAMRTARAGSYNGILFNQETNTITSYVPQPNASTDIVIPKEINGFPVLHIADRAFSYAQITSLNLPEGLLTIGNSAFASNGTLAGTVIIPNSVTSLGARAF